MSILNFFLMRHFNWEPNTYCNQCTPVFVIEFILVLIIFPFRTLVYWILRFLLKCKRFYRQCSVDFFGCATFSIQFNIYLLKIFSIGMKFTHGATCEKWRKFLNWLFNFQLTLYLNWYKSFFYFQLETNLQLQLDMHLVLATVIAME